MTDSPSHSTREAAFVHFVSLHLPTYRLAPLAYAIEYVPPDGLLHPPTQAAIRWLMTLDQLPVVRDSRP